MLKQFAGEQFVGVSVRVFRVRYAGSVLAGAALLLAALALVPATGIGATPSTPYQTQVMRAPDQQAIGRFGESMVVAGDLNRDGTNDLFVAAINVNAGGIAGSGRIHAVSGRTRTVLYSVDSPQPQASGNFGSFISSPGDLDGDGIADLVAGPSRHDVYTGSGTPCGAPEPNGCNERQGKAWVFSGANGALLYDLNNPAPQAGGGFGGRIGAAGDVTGDRRPDIIVSAPSNDQPGFPDEGQAFIFNGVTGQLARTLDLPAEDRLTFPCTNAGGCGNLGGSVQSPGDVNGDRVADQQVAAFNYPFYTGTGTPCGAPEPNGCNERQGRVYIFSGANGQLLRRIDHPFPDDPAPGGTFFGFQDITPNSPGDVTGDGRADIYASASNEGRNQGEGYVFNGATGALLYALRAPGELLGDTFFSMARTDYNKDGTPDLYVGRGAVGTVPTDQNGGTFIYDGRNGSLLKSLELPPEDRQTGIAGNFGPFLGYVVAATGDLNRDCEPDYVASSQRYDEGLVQDVGRLYFFLSAGPSTCPRTPPNYPVPPGPTSACPPGNSGGVTCQALPGGGRRITGTAANNTIKGSPGNDIINCGPGDDVVDAGGGDDLINCGAGNDRVSGGAGNDTVNGESGNDLLSGNKGNDRVLGGSGNERANGNEGNDRVGGQSGNDRVGGQSGRDTLNGDSGRDRVSGGSNNDRTSGGSGNDRVNGDSGNDRVNGGSGRDVLSGGTGRDSISARDRTRDRVNCGRGRDSVSADRRRGRDRVSRNCERVRRS